MFQYRKAPLHKFPAAPDDCLDVLKHVVGAGQADLNADVTRVAVAGDSAGGNLAAVLAQDALAAGIPLKHQLLIYPVTSARVHWFKSWRENQNQPILTARFMLWFWREYLENYEDSTNPRAAPLEAASLRRGICPATPITAEFDRYATRGLRTARSSRRTELRWPHGTLVGLCTPSLAREWASQRGRRASSLGRVNSRRRWRERAAVGVGEMVFSGYALPTTDNRIVVMHPGDIAYGR